MNYTKGEWTTYKDTLTQHATHIEVKHTGHEKQYIEVAYVYHEDDARLISASPDMYEALKNLIYRIDEGLALGSELDIEPARKAIAKAEGK